MRRKIEFYKGNEIQDLTDEQTRGLTDISLNGKCVNELLEIEFIDGWQLIDQNLILANDEYVLMVVFERMYESGEISE